MRPTTSQPAGGISQAAGSQAAGSQAAGSQAAGTRASGSRARGHRARGHRARRSRGLAVAYLLAAATASALVIDAVVHFQDAYFYDANTGALLSQGQLFRIQAGVALVAALGVLAFPKRWPVWLFAALVAGSAAAAVIAYTYIDIGALAGLPNMYEPSWGPPGKLASAIAEIAGALFALAGLAWALAMRRREASPARSTRAAQMAHSGMDQEEAPGHQG